MDSSIIPVLDLHFDMRGQTFLTFFVFEFVPTQPQNTIKQRYFNNLSPHLIICK